MYVLQNLYMPMNRSLRYDALEMLVVKHRLIVSKGILQCSHLAALSTLEHCMESLKMHYALRICRLQSYLHAASVHIWELSFNLPLSGIV